MMKHPSHSLVAVPFAVHSTFRDNRGQKLIPNGLEWDLPGESHLAYVCMENNHNSGLKDTLPVRRGIVDAHNRWCFAKDLPFQKVEDIIQLQASGKHVRVKWKATNRTEIAVKHGATEELIKNDKAVNGGPPAEVWINGEFVSFLSSDTLPSVLETVSEIRSPKLCFKRSDGLIRIERYFRGMIRGEEVFEHVMDNLYALEDPEHHVAENVLMGTATLPDWIMGGMLTSRLWVKELPNGNILCLRPLRNDDVSTSDRTYELVKGRNDGRIEIVRRELTRLRILAALSIPQPLLPAVAEISGYESFEVAKNQGRNRRKKLGW